MAAICILYAPICVFIYALVAQLDRALPSEGKGRWFDSNQVHHFLLLYTMRQSWRSSARRD